VASELHAFLFQGAGYGSGDDCIGPASLACIIKYRGRVVKRTSSRRRGPPDLWLGPVGCPDGDHETCPIRDERIGRESISAGDLLHSQAVLRRDSRQRIACAEDVDNGANGGLG
jgi:hypothetical protein